MIKAVSCSPELGALVGKAPRSYTYPVQSDTLSPPPVNLEDGRYWAVQAYGESVIKGIRICGGQRSLKREITRDRREVSKRLC